VVPSVSRTAAAAATARPGGPIATARRSARGTLPPAGPRTAAIAAARNRYSAAVTPNAIATTRGSRRRALPNLAVSGATASQPTNDSMITAAALPTEAQPCGANGRRLPSCADVADPATAATTTATSRVTSSICTAVLARIPARDRPSTASSRPAATTVATAWPPPARLAT
jgi:hypothetical protein